MNAMLARRLLLLMLVGLAACAQEPPKFPEGPPSNPARYSTGEKSEPAPPPAHGVAIVISPQAQGRSAGVIAFGAGAFLLVVLISLPKVTRAALVPAGIAAALCGPLLALLLTARQLPQMFMERPFEFAEFCLRLWNANRPLMFGLDCAAGCLLILLLLAVLMRGESGETSGGAAVSVVLLSLTVAVAAISFVSFLSMNRLILAAVDPVQSDAIVQSIRSMGIAGVSSAIAGRLMLTFASACASAVLVVMTVGVSLLLRKRVPGRLVAVAIVLVLLAAGAVAEHSWSNLLEATARTGRVQASYTR